MRAGATRVVCSVTNLLPYQSLRNYLPNYGLQNQLEVAFVQENAAMNGEAIVQITNYCEETVFLPVNTVLAEGLQDSEEENEMFAYLEKTEIATAESFDSLFQLDHLDATMREAVVSLLREFKDVFLLEEDTFPATPLLQFEVKVDPNVDPVVRAPYRASRVHEELHRNENAQSDEESNVVSGGLHPRRHPGSARAHWLRLFPARWEHYPSTTGGHPRMPTTGDLQSIRKQDDISNTGETLPHGPRV